MPEKGWSDHLEPWIVDDEAGPPWDFDLNTEYIDWEEEE